MKKFQFILFIIIVGLSSCTIRQEFHFNEDFSGSVVHNLDITMLNSMLQAEGDSETNMQDSLKMFLQQATDLLSEAEGISNVAQGWKSDDNVAYISYDFSNLDALNNSLQANTFGAQAMGLETGDEHTYFVKKRKKLYFKMPKAENDSVVDNEEMKSMETFFRYEIVMHFDKKIRKIKNDNAKLSSDKHSIELSANLFKFYSKDFDSDVMIKFK